MGNAPLVVIQISKNAALHERIEADRANAAPELFEWTDLKTYRHYARGRQRGTLTHSQRQMLEGVHTHRHSDNICKKVVAAISHRLELTGFQVPDKGVDDFIKVLWAKNALADLSGDAHYAVIRDGNHALGLQWHPTQLRPVISRERWWNGDSGVFVAYGDFGEPAYAVKEWTTAKGVVRRTVYFDDRIERYANADGSWQMFLLPGDNGIWPTPWVKRDGSPLHIPIVHLAAGSDDDTPYGGSVLDGGVLGLQDEINDVHRDVTIAARMTGYQMYWATGAAENKDESGAVIPPRVGPGMFHQNDNADAKYGVFAAGDMSQLLSAHRMKLDTVGRNTEVPIHLISDSDWPSGEALIRAELPLILNAQNLIPALKPSWATAAHRAVEMFNAFTVGAELDEVQLIEAEFAPPDRRDQLTLAQIDSERAKVLTALLGLGWSQAALQRMWGLTPDEIELMAAEKSVETQTAAADSILPPIGG